MFICCFLKWFSYIFTGIIALLLIVLFFLSLFNPSAPINESTKTCLITGASSGMGCEIAREMVKRGWKVIGVARRQEKLNDLGHELGATFIPYVCDVANAQQVHEVSEDIKIKGFEPTLFFLNAGTAVLLKKFQPMFNEQKQTFDTNYFGVISWVNEWLNDVKTYGGGTFVATSSIMSIFAGPDTSGYGASKAAVNSCFRSLRLQYRNDNIGFAIVVPGPVKTEMLKGDMKNLPFVHDPKDEALYIVEQVFKRNKQIEPSWLYSYLARILNWLPDPVVLMVWK